jgi:Fungal chitosanase of glycosyl hydrolase group 75
MRRLKLALLGTAVLSLSLLAIPGAHAAVSKPAVAAAAPTASQLLAKTNSCSVASKSKYKTDSDVSSSTINICKSGTAFFWKADMDIDCDGVSTSVCNSGTDDAYQNQTSFETSAGRSFTASSTHYFVIPLPSSRFSYSAQGIKPGTVAAVIFGGRLVYAVFADEGPNNIIGEASYATARDLGIDPNPNSGGTDSGVTYIVFKNSVPSPVENNSAITAKGQAAAAAWLAS